MKVRALPRAAIVRKQFDAAPGAEEVGKRLPVPGAGEEALEIGIPEGDAGLIRMEFRAVELALLPRVADLAGPPRWQTEISWLYMTRE